MNQTLLIPSAIILSGALIAGAVYLSGNVDATSLKNKDDGVERQESPNVYGSEDAAITIVEFSDFECPFCAQVHPIIERIVDESEGKVKWEYRHLPLSIHPNANKAAVAGECIAELAGNDAFWDYAKSTFANQSTLGQAYYQSEAERFNIDADTFNTCLSDPDVEAIVVSDMNRARALGGSGTPFSVIVYEDGSQRPLSGAVLYRQFNAAVYQQ